MSVAFLLKAAESGSTASLTFISKDEGGAGFVNVRAASIPVPMLAILVQLIRAGQVWASEISQAEVTGTKVVIFTAALPLICWLSMVRRIWICTRCS